MMKSNRLLRFLLLRLHSDLSGAGAFLFLSIARFRTRVARECGNWPLAPCLNATRWRRDFFFRSYTATGFPGMSLSGISLNGISGQAYTCQSTSPP